jgi:hypothetical protein
MDGVGDPELVADDGGGWRLYYTARSATGEVSIGLAMADADARTFVAGTAPVLAAGARPDAIGYAMPTVARNHVGTWVLIARARLASGGTRLDAFRSDDGVIFTGVDSYLGAIVDATAVGADEIASPSLAPHGGAWQLVYGRRDGTRWSVGAAASDDLVAWRLLAGAAPVLLGDGNGFDRLGVRDADLVSRGEALELVYVGMDGARDRLGRAYREATTMGGYL